MECGRSPPAVLGVLSNFRRRNRPGVGLAFASNDAEVRAFVRGKCWDLLQEKVHLKHIPFQLLDKFTTEVVIARENMLACPAVREKLGSEHNPGSWSHTKLVKWLKKPVAAFAASLRAALEAQRFDRTLYTQPPPVPPSTATSSHPFEVPLNVIRRHTELSFSSEQGGRQTMEDAVLVLPHLTHLLALDDSKVRLLPASLPPTADYDERRLHPTLRAEAAAAAAAGGVDAPSPAAAEADEASAHTWYAPQIFCGVFDGHRGAEASAYVKAHLHQSILASEFFPTDVVKAIYDGFEKTNTELIRRAMETSCLAGTTATILILLGQDYYVANVGDSSAVLCRTTTAPAPGSAAATAPKSPYLASRQQGFFEADVLTGFHHASNEEEWGAVKARGGTIVEFHGQKRVNGLIALTRTMGFIEACKVMGGTPDVQSGEVTPDVEFFILASDGLWDVMTHREACEYVRAAKAEVDQTVDGKREALLLPPVGGSPAASTAAIQFECEIDASAVDAESYDEDPETSSDDDDDSSPGQTPSLRPNGCFHSFRRAQTAGPGGLRPNSSNAAAVPAAPVLSDEQAILADDELFDVDVQSAGSYGEPLPDDDDPEHGLPFLDYSVISEALVMEAIERGATDNVSCIVVFTNQTQLPAAAEAAAGSTTPKQP